jgi:hypothetical protein
MVFQVTSNNVLQYTATFLHTYMLNKNLNSSITVSGFQMFLNQKIVQESRLLEFLSLMSHTAQLTV